MPGPSSPALRCGGEREGHDRHMGPEHGAHQEIRDGGAG